MKKFAFVLALLFVLVSAFAVLNDPALRSLSPAASANAQALALSTSTPAASPTPYASPTTDPAIVATGTAAAAYLLDIQARQAALDLAIAQSAATMTAFPPAATMTAIAANDAQATANAENTRVNAIVATATEQRLMLLAGTPTALALQQAEVRGNVLTGGAFVGMAVLALAVGGIGRVLVERVKIDNDYRRAELVNMQAGIEQPYTPTIAPEWTPASDGHWVRKPNIRTESERKVAAYVVRHQAWRDDMRNGEGVGLTYDVFTAYRDYLVSIRVLRQEGNGYAVANMDYFTERAGHPSPIA